jgi:hypothetical protein
MPSPLDVHLEVPLALATRQDREVPDELVAVERPDDVLADLDLGVRHLLLEVRGAVVLAGPVDLLDLSEQVGPRGDVVGRQRSQVDVHRERVGRSGEEAHRFLAGWAPWWLRAASSTRSAGAAIGRS